MKKFSVKNVMLHIDYSRLIGRSIDRLINRINKGIKYVAEVSVLKRYEQYYELYDALLKQYDGVHSNSKKCVKNGVFVAIKGMKFNGLNYALDAVKNGARLVVFDENNLEAKNFIKSFVENFVSDQEVNEVENYALKACDSECFIESDCRHDGCDLRYGLEYSGVRFLKVYNAREFLAFASRYYTSTKHDTAISNKSSNKSSSYKKMLLSQPEFLIAVTGTDGKTSTCVFIYQIMKLLKLNCMYMGTVGVKVYEKNHIEEHIKDNSIDKSKLQTKWKETEFSKNLTTFPVEDFFDLITKYKNINVCAFEASSIGIDQHRITFADIAVGIFTNLHEDHIDIHGSYENYKNAKLMLFSKLLSLNGTAIVFDDLQPSVMTEVRNVCSERGIRLLTYGEKNSSSFRILNLRKVPQGYEFEIRCKGVQCKNIRCKKTLINNEMNDVESNFEDQTIIVPIFVPVFVKFQVYNIMAAIIAVMQYGFELSDILQVVNLLHGVKGRMERVLIDVPYNLNESKLNKKGSSGVSLSNLSEITKTITKNLNIFVDYAHTPNALQTLLKNVQQSYSKIIVVFGCGGERDATKRSKMGAIAYELANIIVITDDNPRNEDAASIRKEVLSKCPNGIEVSGRKDAIFRGVKLLIDVIKENDVENCCLIIAGKGHENYQIIGNEKIDFDDYAVAQEAVIYFDQTEVNNKMDNVDIVNTGSNIDVNIEDMKKEEGVLWTKFDIRNALHSELQLSTGESGEHSNDASYAFWKMPKINCYGCSIDTRNLKKGDLFFAIDGKHINGAKFWLDALRNGAECVIANKSNEALMKDVLQNELSKGANRSDNLDNSSISHINRQNTRASNVRNSTSSVNISTTEDYWKRVIFVENTRNALKKMAQFARKRTNAYTIGVTGSVGKTTTKDILYFALKNMNFRVHRSEKSFNNDLGLPLSLVNMPKNAEIGVFEIGMNNPGEIHSLARDILKPNMGLVVSIAPVHIGNFDYIYKIFREKCSLFDCISDIGILNEDVFFPRYYKDTSILNLLNVIGKDLRGRTAGENLNLEELEKMLSLVTEDMEKTKQCIKNISIRKDIQLLRKNDLELSSYLIEKSQEADLLKVKIKQNNEDINRENDFDTPLQIYSFLINIFNKSIVSNFYIAFMAILHLRNKVFRLSDKSDSRFDNLKTAFVNFSKVSGRGKISHIMNSHENSSGNANSCTNNINNASSNEMSFFIIDESYNANLMSMKNALSELRRCDLSSYMKNIRNVNRDMNSSDDGSKNISNIADAANGARQKTHKNIRKIAVLGDMKELGIHSIASHVELIRYYYEFFGKNLFNDVNNDMDSSEENANGNNESKIILVGNEMAQSLNLLRETSNKENNFCSGIKDDLFSSDSDLLFVGDGSLFGGGLLKPDFNKFLNNIIIFKNANEVLEYLKKNIKNNDVVMIKGSNSLGLRKIVIELKGLCFSQRG